MSAVPPRKIEVYADVWCPFTHVGLRRLVTARDERGHAEVVLRVRPWALELVNGEPLDAGFVAEEVALLRDAVAPDLFAGFTGTHFPHTTLPALHLAEAAYAQSPRTGEAVSLELRDLLFEQDADVSDPEVLEAVAEVHGIGPASEPPLVDPVEASLAEGRGRGVVGSPHFFVHHDEGFFCPALDVRKVDGHLRVAADPGAFTAFVDACFA